MAKIKYSKPVYSVIGHCVLEFEIFKKLVFVVRSSKIKTELEVYL